MRVLLAFMAFALCLAEGLRASLLLKRRAALIEELCELLSGFAIEIRCCAPTLDELCERAGGTFADLLKGCRADAPDIITAWENACKKLSELPCCRKDEAELMRTLGRSLGRSDAAGELSLLAMYKEKLETLGREAREEFAGKGKLFRSVGTLCGIGAAILII